MSSPFLGSDFRLETVNPIGLATVRVRFTQDPLLSDGATGALNIDNYAVTGPVLNYVTGASQVLADPQAIDLYLAAPLEIGQWTLAVSNVVFENGSAPLLPPTSLTFTVDRTAVEEGVPKGAVNDEVVNVLRKFLNPALKGPGWDSMIEALAAGDKTNWDNAKLAFNQLFIPSASGAYLNRRAADQGIRRPSALAMPDSLFRDLAIISKTRKLTQDAILEVLEVFYGSEAVRATITTSFVEPFALEDNDDLQLMLDERDQVNIVFSRSQFARIGEASALEVAAAITRQLHAADSSAYAIAHRNQDGNNEVRIYSGRLGIASALRVIGGKAQTSLRFTSGNSDPDYVFTQDVAPFATWEITKSTSNLGYLRFTLNGASTTFDDFNKLVEGDKVLIYGAEFDPANRGTFDVTAVGIEYPGPTQWFEIENPDGVAQAALVQNSYKSLQFHRSRKRTIYNELRHTLVSQAEGTIDVIIPATTQAVRRRPKTASYTVLPPEVQISELQRGNNPTYGGDHVYATTVTAHGLSVNDMVLVENAFPDLPAIATVAASGSISAASTKSIMSPTGTLGRWYHRGVRLPGNVALFVGGETDAPASTPIPQAFTITAVNYDPKGRRKATGNWATLSSSLTTGRRDFGCSTADIRTIVTGGWSGSGSPSNVWNILSYSPSQSLETLRTGTMPAARAGHGQATLENKVLVCGGFTVAGTEIATAYEFNLDTLAWASKPAMSFARAYPEAVQVGDGILVTGGRLVSSSAVLNTCEFWDGSAWTQVGSLATARYGHALVALPDGRVLAIGGTGYNPSRTTTPTALKSCEIWDNNARFWIPIQDMADARAYPSAVYVPALNAVVVAGGDSLSCELLDLETMTWRKSLAELGHERYRTQGVLLQDDFVIFGGGAESTGGPYQTTALSYLFIPAGETVWKGGFDGPVKVVAVPSTTEFVYKTPGYQIKDITHCGRTFSGPQPDLNGDGHLPLTWFLSQSMAMNGTERQQIEIDPVIRLDDYPGSSTIKATLSGEMTNLDEGSTATVHLRRGAPLFESLSDPIDFSFMITTNGLFSIESAGISIPSGTKYYWMSVQTTDGTAPAPKILSMVLTLEIY
jgi:hypothetical protein